MAFQITRFDRSKVVGEAFAAANASSFARGRLIGFDHLVDE